MKRNRPVYRLCTVLLAGAMVILSTGCAMPKAEPEQPTPTTPPPQENTSQQTVLFATLAPESAASGSEPTPEEVQESTPEPTQAPQKTSVTIGAVGDIMVMPSQIAGAYDETSDGEYDFTHSFVGVQTMFRSIDLMCGNFEGAMAGESVGYSNGRTDEEGRIKFNAPDVFAENLKSVGFDCITTANNHAGDCDAEGVIHTIDAIQNADLYQTGTFRSKNERKPLVIDVNGIRIGVMATTTVINGSSNMSRQQKNDMFSRLQYFDEIEAEIAACKEEGAEFIVMFAHWDEEYETKPQRSTKKYASQLLAAGVDAVIGSHPHVVQPLDYVTVTRSDGSEYTGFVAYSLGNFLSNMTGECAYGMFLRLTIERDDDGSVKLKDACYMPTLCFSEELPAPTESKPGRTKTVHQLVPALEDASQIVSYHELDDREKKLVARAREYVLKICGTSPVPVMEDSCWIN